jgi:hypothetical protein
MHDELLPVSMFAGVMVEGHHPFCDDHSCCVSVSSIGRRTGCDGFLL